MNHQTNLDCKSFSISEDLVETIVALTLNITKWYFWMILWLMMMNHHTKFDWSEILSGQTFAEVQNLHCDLDLEYSKATFSQHSSLWTCIVKLGRSPPKISSSEHIIEIVIFECMNRYSVTATLTLKIESHFFTWHSGSWLCTTIPSLVTKDCKQTLSRVGTNVCHERYIPHPWRNDCNLFRIYSFVIKQALKIRWNVVIY